MGILTCVFAKEARATWRLVRVPKRLKNATPVDLFHFEWPKATKLAQVLSNLRSQERKKSRYEQMEREMCFAVDESEKKETKPILRLASLSISCFNQKGATRQTQAKRGTRLRLVAF